jgi:RNA polymerase sigma factor (TIGR02999 family)
MSDLSNILEPVHMGDRQAAAQLFPLIYDELRKLAAIRMANESPDHTLDATALVHEAYLRLVGAQEFDGRSHFFAAAAESMRRILVESARRKNTAKRGGQRVRVQLPEDLFASQNDSDVLSVDEALNQLAMEDGPVAELVKLRFFAGLSLDAAAEVLGISPRTAYRNWQYARAWLYRRLGGDARISE